MNQLLILTLLAQLISIESYKIGVGRADSTGPIVEVPFMGYAKFSQTGKGIHLRLYSRAFVIEDDGNRIAFVSVDSAMISESLKSEVLKHLRVEVGDVYNEKNLILSAIHTHSAPGGFMGHLLFDFTCLGFIKETFRAMTTGITRAILRAHNSLVEGRIFISSGEVLNANINRSPQAYMENPEEERNAYAYDVDKELVQVKFVDLTGNLLGAINWFPVHPTSMNNTNRLVSSDNIGYASILLEKELNPTALPGKGKFVGAFASTNLGDVSPNLKGPHCLDTGKSCNNIHSTCNGRSELCVSFGPGENMFESTKIIANRLYRKASELLRDQTEEITGPIQFTHRFVNMSEQSVEYKTKNGEEIKLKGCSPAMGYSFAAGTTDGPGEDNFQQGIDINKRTRGWNIFSLFGRSNPEDVECHHPKKILLTTGRIHYPFTWQPSIVPIQVAILGKIAIIAVPGEFTTMAGRRLKNAISEKLKENERFKDNRVIIAGLSNSYSDYITTPEEYQVQRYEGASTIYGPNTLPIYINLYEKLTEQLISGGSRNFPLEVNPHIFPLNNLIGLVLPVLFDTSGRRKFGDCVQEPNEIVTPGDNIKVEFVTANPRNNWRQEKTFLTVEKLENSWKIIATDSNWETKFIWNRESKFSSTSTATIEWEIPVEIQAGIYRIRHFGTSKSFWGGFKDFEGTTKPFNIT